jgi:hypothetical protein
VRVSDHPNFGTAENVIDVFACGRRHNPQVIVFATGELPLDRLVVFGADGAGIGASVIVAADQSRVVLQLPDDHFPVLI